MQYFSVQFSNLSFNRFYLSNRNLTESVETSLFLDNFKEIYILAEAGDILWTNNTKLRYNCQIKTKQPKLIEVNF